ncbi:Protein CBG23847 [Caenorhabditis briggsae]|uniref:Protein CBG23847 n=1 Tax=Caenorhabditis briggsae TaxID=6238 RepID=A8WJF6_CAEBR|nr:Protein CBG23847 [Caenorhabditis briggsae]CAP20598.2 Protein CBG23847 [Caenorhabditis briggsae]
MKGYKYCLCYLQFVSFITELHMSWICPGYYFFPLIGGYNTGAEFISSHLSMTLYVFIFAFELPSTLSCFIFRHKAAEEISRTNPSKMYVEKFMLILCHIFPFAGAFAMFNSQLTFEQKYDYLQKNWPECMIWMKFDAFEVYDYVLNPWLAVVGIGAISFVLLVYGAGNRYNVPCGLTLDVFLRRDDFEQSEISEIFEKESLRGFQIQKFGEYEYGRANQPTDK